MKQPANFIDCSILGALLVALASVAGRAEPARAADRAATASQHSSSVSALTEHAVHRSGGAVSAAPSVGTARASRILKPTPPRITVAHFTPNLPQPHAVAGVSGSAVGRHTALSGTLGGPATYNAKKGAVISGSAIRGKY